MFPWLYDWLLSADSPHVADLIFVLAGLESRKIFALEVFQNHLAPRILFSVGRYEIRRFANLALPLRVDLLQMAQSVPPPLRHYFVQYSDQKFEVRRILASGLGTMREIEALAQWLEAHPDISSLLVVSSGFHLRRVRLCCRMLLPRGVKVYLLAVPEEDPGSSVSGGGAGGWTRKMILTELLKISCYFVILPFRRLVRTRRRLFF